MHTSIFFPNPQFPHNNSENIEVMASGYSFVANFIHVIQEHATKYRSRLFSYLLTLQSIPSLPAEMGVNFNFNK
jgi:hypothetical protein